MNRYPQLFILLALLATIILRVALSYIDQFDLHYLGSTVVCSHEAKFCTETHNYSSEILKQINISDISPDNSDKAHAIFAEILQRDGRDVRIYEPETTVKLLGNYRAFISGKTPEIVVKKHSPWRNPLQGVIESLAQFFTVLVPLSVLLLLYSRHLEKKRED